MGSDQNYSEIRQIQIRRQECWRLEQEYRGRRERYGAELDRLGVERMPLSGPGEPVDFHDLLPVVCEHEWLPYFKPGHGGPVGHVCRLCGVSNMMPPAPDCVETSSSTLTVDGQSKREPFIGKHTIYGVDKEHDTPYMTRMWIGRLRLHIFHRPDQDRDCHDHPWDFWTFPLTSYVEEVVCPGIGIGYIQNEPKKTLSKAFPTDTSLEIVRAFRPHFRLATHAHRVLGRYDDRGETDFSSFPTIETKSGKIVTIVWRSHTKRKWGFLKNRDGRWCWMPWKEYVFNGGKHAPCE